MLYVHTVLYYSPPNKERWRDFWVIIETSTSEWSNTLFALEYRPKVDLLVSNLWGGDRRFVKLAISSNRKGYLLHALGNYPYAQAIKVSTALYSRGGGESRK